MIAMMNNNYKRNQHFTQTIYVYGKFNLEFQVD